MHAGNSQTQNFYLIEIEKISIQMPNKCCMRVFNSHTKYYKIFQLQSNTCSEVKSKKTFFVSCTLHNKNSLTLMSFTHPMAS